MAIKIISPGKPPNLKEYKGKCIHCGCVVACTQGDCRYEEDRPGDGGYCVVCPTCGNRFLWVQPKRIQK